MITVYFLRPHIWRFALCLTMYQMLSFIHRYMFTNLKLQRSIWSVLNSQFMGFLYVIKTHTTAILQSSIIEERAHNEDQNFALSQISFNPISLQAIISIQTMHKYSQNTTTLYDSSPFASEKTILVRWCLSLKLCLMLFSCTWGLRGSFLFMGTFFSGINSGNRTLELLWSVTWKQLVKVIRAKLKFWKLACSKWKPASLM